MAPSIKRKRRAKADPTLHPQWTRDQLRIRLADTYQEVRELKAELFNLRTTGSFAEAKVSGDLLQQGCAMCETSMPHTHVSPTTIKLPDPSALWPSEESSLLDRIRVLEAVRDDAQAQSNRDLQARRSASGETQASIEEWRKATFGSTSTTSRLAVRANLEMAELLDALSVGDTNPAAAAECADVVIVIMGIATKLGVDLMEEVNKKMAINRTRMWNVAGDGTGKHVRVRETPL